MNARSLLAGSVLAVAAIVSGTEASAQQPREFPAQALAVGAANEPLGTTQCLPNRQAWHGNYYQQGWSGPVALVVPPTATMQTKWGWGVGNTRVAPINYQFRRAWPGQFQPTGYGYLPTPAWPSDTDQFGVYYARGPW